MPSPKGHARHLDPADGHAARPAPTIAEVVNGVFSRCDADLDGSITLTDVLNVVDASGQYTDLVARITNLASTLDSNADGSLGKDELTAAVGALDTDHSGAFERGDLAAGGAAAGTTITLPELLTLVAVDRTVIDRHHGRGPVHADRCQCRRRAQHHGGVGRGDPARYEPGRPTRQR